MLRQVVVGRHLYLVSGVEFDCVTGRVTFNRLPLLVVQFKSSRARAVYCLSVTDELAVAVELHVHSPIVPKTSYYTAAGALVYMLTYGDLSSC